MRSERTGTGERSERLLRIFESFTETLEFDDVVQRIVEVTRATFAADRCWLIGPTRLDRATTPVEWESAVPEYPGKSASGEPVDNEGSRRLIEALLEADGPVATFADDERVDQAMFERFRIESQLAQIVRLGDGTLWGFGLHQCSHRRVWTGDDTDDFRVIARFVRIALTNALTHRLALSEEAKVRSALDHISDPVLLFDRFGHLEQVNQAGRLLGAFPGVATSDCRIVDRDGVDLADDRFPQRRALAGEVVREELRRIEPDGTETIFQVRARPVRDEDDRVVGALLHARDVTEEKLFGTVNDIRDRYATLCSSLDPDTILEELRNDHLDPTAAAIASALGGGVMIHLVRGSRLPLVGRAGLDGPGQRYAEWLDSHPPSTAEGLAGAVIELGRPLLYSVVENALHDFSRSDEERELAAALGRMSLCAVPIPGSDAPAGALVLFISEARSAGELELRFACDVAERLGLVTRMATLRRLSNEGLWAAEELARKEVGARARLEAVLESSPIGIAVVSADELRFEMVNGRWLEFAALQGHVVADDDLVGHRLAEAVPMLEQTVRSVAESGEPWNRLAMSTGPLERKKHFDIVISPVRGRLSGITQSVTILAQDVSESVARSRELESLALLMQERSARLDSILASMTDALWIYDIDGRVVDVNPSAVDFFGLASRAEAIEHGSFDSFDLRYPDGRPVPHDERPHARALKGEIIPAFIATVRHRIDGRRLDVSIAAAPIVSQGIVGAVLVIRDVGALQELDRKKDEFLSVASHELRTPLTTIRGYAQLMRSVSDLGESERNQYLEATLREIERMMVLIGDLLDVSRIESSSIPLSHRSTDWIGLVSQEIERFRVQFPERAIHFSAPPDSVLLEVDEPRMKQVIDNLVSNALKYSADDQPVAVEIAVDDDGVDTRIHDRGIGIPDEEFRHLFERFHRARNVSSRHYGGLGLGLYIASAIVEAHGGRIDVESREGEGSTFSLRIPFERKAEPLRY